MTTSRRLYYSLTYPSGLNKSKVVPQSPIRDDENTPIVEKTPDQKVRNRRQSTNTVDVCRMPRKNVLSSFRKQITKSFETSRSSFYSIRSSFLISRKRRSSTVDSINSQRKAVRFNNVEDFYIIPHRKELLPHKKELWWTKNELAVTQELDLIHCSKGGEAIDSYFASTAELYESILCLLRQWQGLSNGDIESIEKETTFWEDVDDECLRNVIAGLDRGFRGLERWSEMGNNRRMRSKSIVKKIVQEASSENASNGRQRRSRLYSFSDSDSDNTATLGLHDERSSAESLCHYSMALSQDCRVWAQVCAQADAAVAAAYIHSI